MGPLGAKRTSRSSLRGRLPDLSAAMSTSTSPKACEAPFHHDEYAKLFPSDASKDLASVRTTASSAMAGSTSDSSKGASLARLCPNRSASQAVVAQLGALRG